MLKEPFLVRLIVIRRDDQHAVGARLFGVLCQLHRLVRVVRAGAGDHRDAAFRLGDANLDHMPVFLVRQGRALASRPDRHQPMRATLDLPVD